MRLFGPFRPICSAVSVVLRDDFASAPLDAFPIVGQNVGQTANAKGLFQRRNFRAEVKESIASLASSRIMAQIRVWQVNSDAV